MKYQTPIGYFDGDSWELLCQFCLKTKFGGEYIEVPASPGDYGLDGFNLGGDAFQCYCPEKEATDKELYESQRDKITKDIKKLNDYKIKLEELLNGKKLKRWFLLTPISKRNEILFHCKEKTDLVKSWSLPFIHKDFRVMVMDYQYFSKELPYAFHSLDYVVNSDKIVDRVETEAIGISPNLIANYKIEVSNDNYTQNAFRKQTARYPKNNGKDYSSRILEGVDRVIESNLIGDNILKDWEMNHQSLYERFMKVIKALERQVHELTEAPTENNETRYKEIHELTKNTIDKEFYAVSDATRRNLALWAIADWLLRCPLNLE